MVAPSPDTVHGCLSVLTLAYHLSSNMYFGHAPLKFSSHVTWKSLIGRSTKTWFYHQSNPETWRFPTLSRRKVKIPTISRRKENNQHAIKNMGLPMSGAPPSYCQLQAIVKGRNPQPWPLMIFQHGSMMWTAAKWFLLMFLCMQVIVRTISNSCKLLPIIYC